MKKNNFKFNKGFTLVETLVAIAIFSVSVLGLLVILSQGISNTNYAKQKITAAYLSEEGIEYLRNIRDTSVLYDTSGSQHGWDAFKNVLYNASCNTTNGCYVNNRSFTACGSSCPNILYDSTTGSYGYTTGVNSGFIRKIQMSDITADEIKVFSVVSWTQGSGSYNINLSENLLNWGQ